MAKPGFNYAGTHWTQTPEGKERMSKQLRKAARLRKKNAIQPAIRGRGKVHALEAATHNREEGVIQEKALIPPTSTEISYRQQPVEVREQIAATSGRLQQIILTDAITANLPPRTYASWVLEHLTTPSGG